MISRALLNAPFFIPKDADLLRNRKVNTKKRQNRHLPELAFLILGTYFTAPIFFTLCFLIRFFGYIPFSLLLLYMFSLYLFFNPYPIIYISLDQIIYNRPQRHSYKKSDYSKQSISKEDRKYHPEWREPG